MYLLNARRDALLLKPKRLLTYYVIHVDIHLIRATLRKQSSRLLI